MKGKGIKRREGEEEWGKGNKEEGSGRSTRGKGIKRRESKES